MASSQNENCKPNISVVLEEKIERGEISLKKCKAEPLATIDGIKKLAKKLEAELNFLKRLRNNQHEVLDAHVGSSNLVHLAACVHTAAMPGVVAILKPFRYTTHEINVSGLDETKKLVIDVVRDYGLTWVKVVARNPDSMDFISTGQGHFGEKSILEHAQVYLNCAKQNMVYFRIPVIKFLFYNGISDELHQKLTACGVFVQCPEQVSSINDADPLDVRNKSILSSKVLILNLDVSTMMAYVSSLSNGGTNFVFREKILTEHADMERNNPIKIFLDKIFEGRQLVACETALKGFQGILDKVGGDGEKQRADTFLQRVTVIPDSGYGSTSVLKRIGKIRERSMTVFGAGESVQAVTVTANAGFVRAAHSQQLDLPAIVHESRMLTEQKEKTAVRISR